MRVAKRLRDEYEGLLKSIGEPGFYSYVLKSGKLARKHFEHPETMLLDQSDAFFSLFRATGNSNYFTIGRVLRRVAHRIYRENKKKDIKHPINDRFLDIVK